MGGSLAPSGRKGLRRAWGRPVAVVLAAGLIAGDAAAAIREEEPVLVPAASLQGLAGSPVGSLALFAWDPGAGAFVAVPFQIDERVDHVFNAGTAEEFTSRIYDVLGEDDGLLDAIDELAFLFRDAGPAAPPGAAWPAGADTLRHEIRVTDPRVGAPSPERFVYLFRGTGLPVSPTQYVSWNGLAGGSIASDALAMDYTDRWLLTGLRVLTPCGTGEDLLDRVKLRAGLVPEQAETEEDWNLSSSFLGGRSGPVRAIRYVRGAASGVNTLHHDVTYRRHWRRFVELRVHPLNAVWQYLDWRPRAGLTLFTPTLRTGIAQDGLPDGPPYSPLEDWHLMRSPAGGLVFQYDFPPSPLYGAVESYLRDDAAYDDGPLGYPDEDDAAYGNHGFRISSLTGSSTDAVSFSFGLWPLCSAEGDAALGDAYQELRDVPLSAAAAAQRPAGGIVDLSLTKTVDNPAPEIGSDVVFTVTVWNDPAAADASGVQVSDLLPSGYAFVSDDAGGAYDPVGGLWGVGLVDAGAQAALRITATVLGSGEYRNEAEVVAADQADLDDLYGNGLGEDHDAATTSPVAPPTIDLSLTKTVDDPFPAVGSDVVFTVSLSNAAGFGDASGVQVTDLLPAGYDHVGDDGAGAYDPPSGIWSVGSLASGAATALRITARVLGGGGYTNTAEVTAADQVDANDLFGDGAGADFDSATTTPTPVVDLSLAKTVDDPGPPVGAEVVFTVTVRNAAGFSDATGVQVVDLLPSGYDYRGDDSGASGTTYDKNTGLWSVGGLTAAGAATLNLTARVHPSGDWTNVAEITAADQPDRNDVFGDGAGNDHATAVTTPGSVRTVRARREGNDVVLNWAPLPNALAYRVYASASAAAPKASWSLLAETALPEFRDVGAATGPGDRHYSVVTVTPGGEGPH